MKSHAVGLPAETLLLVVCDAILPELCAGGCRQTRLRDQFPLQIQKFSSCTVIVTLVEVAPVRLVFATHCVRGNISQNSDLLNASVSSRLASMTTRILGDSASALGLESRWTWSSGCLFRPCSEDSGLPHGHEKPPRSPLSGQVQCSRRLRQDVGASLRRGLLSDVTEFGPTPVLSL